MKLKVGDHAPSFTTKDQDGKSVSLSDFKGQKVVLYFYPNDMTPGCTAEACSLRDNYKYMQKQGYVVLGISSNDEKSHKKFIAKEKLPFSLLADTDKSVHEKYGTWGEKSMYGRKYMGTLRVTFVIDENGTINDIIEKVDTKNHASQIIGEKAVPTKESAPAAKPKKKPLLSPANRKPAAKGVKKKK